MRFTYIVVEYPSLDYDLNCALSSGFPRKLLVFQGNGARRHMDHMVNLLPFFYFAHVKFTLTEDIKANKEYQPKK